jgi:hypothetical protein
MVDVDGFASGPITEPSEGLTRIWLKKSVMTFPFPGKGVISQNSYRMKTVKNMDRPKL